MQEADKLLTKKQELEQLIKYNQEHYLQSNQLGAQLSSYASHPADMAAHLQVLNIELEKINAALAQIEQEPNGGYEHPAPELH
jgi:hypothetical protein